MGDIGSEGENLIKLRINHHQLKNQIPIGEMTEFFTLRKDK
jgi:hypothetical protein